MGYKVKLNVFEGPFDLLVYLIENAKMSVYDIQVSQITSQYIKYIEQMQEMDVQLSSEFMVLAAELIEIKSKMLLPRMKEDGEGELAEDPRDDLVARILEYKKYKTISSFLQGQELEARRIKEKPQEDISVYLEDPDEILKLDMDQFVNAFDAFLRRRKKAAEMTRRYERREREKISAEDRMRFIKKLFEIDANKTVNFNETLQSGGNKYDKALSFSSMLEMIKQDRLTAEQKAIFADIYLHAGKALFEEVEEDHE